MKKKSFPLENYFMYLSDHLLDDAEELLTGGHLILREKSKDNLWVFEAEEDRSVEIEILLKRKTVANYTCDCAKYAENGICKHIGAAVRFIHKSLEEKESITKRKPTPKIPKGPLHIPHLLSQLTTNELQQFIRNYARKNPQFALELKMQFAHKVPLKNDLHKYFDLLKKFSVVWNIPPVTKSKVKKLRSYLGELLLLGEDLISVSEYMESFNVLFGILKFGFERVPFLAKDSLREPLVDTHKKIDFLLQADLAPGYVQSMIDHLGELIHDPNYIVLDQRWNLFSLLYKSSSIIEKNKIIRSLENRITKSAEDTHHYTLMDIYLKAGRIEDMIYHVIRHQSNVPLINYTFAQLKDLKSPYLILAEQIYWNTDHPKLKHLAFKKLVGKFQSKENAVNWYKEYFYIRRDINLYKKLKELRPAQWNKILKDIIQFLEEVPDYPTLLQILILEDRAKSSFDLIEDQNNLDLTTSTIGYLHSQDSVRTKKIILDQMSDYLSTHIGQQSASYINRHLQILTQSNLFSLAHYIQEELLKRFQERTFLRKNLKNVP